MTTRQRHIARNAAWLLAATLALPGCKPNATQPANAQNQAIAWREGDVDDALAEAKESGKPVFLYWGAKWCPPCNQLKSTLFKDPAFIAQTRNFVPVYLDGDLPGAQQWGERFGISGYPTVIVLRADGSEITRLSSATTTARLADVLRVAAARTLSAEALLQRAAGNTGGLSQDDWQLLAAFDWQNDPKHFGDKGKAAQLLAHLSEGAPSPALQRRFGLLALATGAEQDKEGHYKLTAAQQTRLVALVPPLLANPDEVTANHLELSYNGGALVAALPDPATRARLGDALTTALDRVHGDTALPLPDRLATVSADIALAKAGGAKASPAVLAKVRERAAWADKSATDAQVRQSVISNAADLLHQAGDDAGARRLLEAELKRSASPYYYMLDLSRLAEETGDKAAAIAWARKAFETAQGQATRVQWGIEYAKAVLRLSPDDKSAVEASSNAVIDELGKNADSYYQRTRTKIAAWGKLLQGWGEAKGNRETVEKINARMTQVCGRQGDGQAACRGWLGAG